MKNIAIVDCFSSATQYLNHWQKNGIKCFHIVSSKNLPDYYLSSIDNSLFADSLTHQNLEQSLEWIMHNSIDFVHAGTESGVSLAEQLSNCLGLASNDINKLEARRNKYYMWETLKSYKLETAWFQKLETLSELDDFAEDLQFPLVAKPPSSAGGDAVRICHVIDELLAAAKEIIGKKNKLGITNEFLLLQEYIEGPEYAVNFVSWKSTHFCTNIWRYHKKIIDDKYIIYDWEELVDPSSQEANKMIDYLSKCLDALGVQNSPSHCEVKLTKEGPRIIEIAARLDGISNPKFDSVCCSDTQVELFINTILNDELKPNSKSIGRYERLKFASNVEMISSKSGKIKEIRFDLLRQLESYVDEKWFINIDTPLSKTIDLFSSPGIVFLANSDLNKLMSDIQRIRKYEESGLIMLE
jgi:biotin carboxylase